jgi:putative PIG3 family NAD(P)H quinone oxidoreductase
VRAVVIITAGGPEGLEVRRVDSLGEACADRVRVRVRAAALNRADLLQREGRYPAPPGYPPHILGIEFAGEIEQIGEEVRAWHVGQRVFGIIGGGGQAEYVVVPENTLAEIPSRLDWAEAAAVPEAFITAHDALFTQAGLQPGESVIVHAAGSGVGTAAVQLARTAGATVIGTSRTDDKLKRAMAYGLSLSVAVQNDPNAFVTAARRWTRGRGADVVLDLVGAAYFQANLEALAPRGRLMLVGGTSGVSARLDFGMIMRKRLRIAGTVLRSRSLEEKATATRLFANHVLPLLEAGTVRPVIDSIYNIGEVRAAHERLASNETFGKVVLMLD